MLEAAIYYLLKKHFRQEKYYVDLLELFHEVRPLSALSLVHAKASLTDLLPDLATHRSRSKPSSASSSTSSRRPRTRST